jgi:antitoxin component YwqK of YwqJK toxin-antitoxin module
MEEPPVGVTKTDSGWLRNDYYLGTRTLQISGLYEDSTNKIANGYFRFFYPNGIPESFGKNVHNKKEGLWMRYHQNALMQDSTVYINGMPVGTSLGWHANGFLADSIVYGNDGMAVEVRWNTNGNPSCAGRLKNDTLTGPWVYFHKNGQVAAMENYDMGVLKSVQYYDSSAQKTEKPIADRKAMFPADRWDGRNM